MQPPRRRDAEEDAEKTKISNLRLISNYQFEIEFSASPRLHLNYETKKNAWTQLHMLLDANFRVFWFFRSAALKTRGKRDRFLARLFHVEHAFRISCKERSPWLCPR